MRIANNLHQIYNGRKPFNGFTVIIFNMDSMDVIYDTLIHIEYMRVCVCVRALLCLLTRIMEEIVRSFDYVQSVNCYSMAFFFHFGLLFLCLWHTICVWIYATGFNCMECNSNHSAMFQKTNKTVKPFQCLYYSNGIHLAKLATPVYTHTHTHICRHYYFIYEAIVLMHLQLEF